MSKKASSERNVNLDHHIPSESLLSLNEYEKVPPSQEAQLHKKDGCEFNDFRVDPAEDCLWYRLRKPEFQRETNSWDDDKILNLLETIHNNQVIPGVILWLNTETTRIFVLDGAHRLSTIRAWITDDWGDSKEAIKYGYVEKTECEAADRIRRKIEEKIGSYKTCMEAKKRFQKLVDEKKNPADLLDPETEARGRFMGNLSTALRIPIQWVIGNYQTAEKSFLNINTRGTPLSHQEVTYLENRRSPGARAIAGIVANGTKSSFWLGHTDECNKLSKELHSTILAPSSFGIPPERVSDYPLCFLKKQNNFESHLLLQNVFSVSAYGVTGEDNQRKIITEYADEKDDHTVADKTLEHLQRVSLAISHIYGGKRSQSLSLYPAFYFYTNKGQYSDFLFLLFLSWASRGNSDEILNRKKRFTLARDLFEEVWMMGKESIFRAFGRKGAGPSRLTSKHITTLQELIDFTLESKEKSLSPYEVLDSFLRKMDHNIHEVFIKEQQEQGKPFARFSESTKKQGEFWTLFQTATHSCEICGGKVLIGHHQSDHKKLRSQGGTSSYKNMDLIHPFCNRHKNQLEGLIKRFANTSVDINQRLDLQLPQPKPDPDTSEQLTFDF